MKCKSIVKTTYLLVIAMLIGILFMFTTVFAENSAADIELKRDLTTNGIYLKSNSAQNDQIMILVQYRNNALKSVKINPVDNGEGYSSNTDICTDYEPTDVFKGFLWESKESALPVLSSISSEAKNIEAPVLWLDAADVNTLTVSDGKVSNWKDKSGNGRDVYQETAANQPAYVEGEYVYTNGDETTPTFLENRLPFMAANSHTLFLIGDFENLSADDSSQYYISENSTTDNNPSYVFFYHVKSGSYYTSAIRGTTSSMKKIGVPDNYWTAGKQLHIYTDDKTNTKIGTTVYRDDATVISPPASYSNVFATTDAAADIFSIGARRHYKNSGNPLAVSYPGACKFREILIYDGVLDEARITEIKEYLLNKWDLEPPVASAEDELVADSLSAIALAPDSSDDKQYAYYYLPSDALDDTKTPVPLVVGLHSWGNGYNASTKDLFYEKAKEYGWAMIHPDYRGGNTNPDACASELAMGDIVNAVEFMKTNANIDESRIYLIGASGGGHMALMMASKHPEIWAAVSAYVPITDLEAWYNFSKGCATDDDTTNDSVGSYYIDIAACCGGAPGESDAVDLEYYNRSPINFITNAKNIPLDINAGIKDGHGSQSVPISHALNAFNKLAEDGGYTDKIISDADIEYMVANKALPDGIDTEAVDNDAENREYAALFRRTAGNARVTLFNGGHTKDYAAAFKFCSDKVKTN